MCSEKSCRCFFRRPSRACVCRVRSGAYGPASDGLRAGLLAADRGDERDSEAMRRSIKAALDDPPQDIPAADPFAQLTTKYLARMKASNRL